MDNQDHNTSCPQEIQYFLQPHFILLISRHHIRFKIIDLASASSFVFSSARDIATGYPFLPALTDYEQVPLDTGFCIQYIYLLFILILLIGYGRLGLAGSQPFLECANTKFLSQLTSIIHCFIPVINKSDPID